MSVQIRIPKYVGEIGCAAAKEAGRYALHGINLKVTKKGDAVACVTDGKILVEVKLGKADEADLGCSVIVDPKAFKAALATCHAKGKDPLVTIDADNHRVLVVEGDGSKIEVPLMDGTFPDYHDVIPAETSSVETTNASIGLAVTLVQRVTNALWLACGGRITKEEGLLWAFHGPKQPTRIDYLKGELRGRAVIMPIALEKGEVEAAHEEWK